MNEDLKQKYESMSINDIKELVNKKSDTLTIEERSYLSGVIYDARKKEKEESKKEFRVTDKQKIDGNVAIVFDLDETLVRRGTYLKDDNNNYISQTDYTLARPGLFELLDGLKKLKQEYETSHPGYKFNIYAFTSGPHNNTEEFQSFLGEEYASIFKDFFNSESNEYVRTRTKGIHLLPEDTVLYFGDMDASVIWGKVASHARDNQRILCYEITGFNGESFENALLFREYNRTLFQKIQEMIQNGDEKANSYKTKLDELSIKILDYFDKIKKSDRIDTLLDTITSQLNGENNDPVYSFGEYCDRKSACKNVKIGDIDKEEVSNLEWDLHEEYDELFGEIYGKDSQVVMSNIEDDVYKITKSKYSGENSFEKAEARARFHPAEVYPHSKRYKDADLGKEESR